MINKLKKVSFLFSFIRLYFRKIMTLYTYFLWVTLESMIPWKIHWASHYHFCQFWNGIVRFFQVGNIFIWKSSVFGEFIPIQFYWRKIWPLFRSQFCPGFFQIFMSHYRISPFGERYKITFRVITFLFVEGYGILVY